jgi:heptosyltransferase-2
MTDPRTILVVRLSALGDIVLALPTVESLRARYPRARIVFLARDPEGRILEGVRTIDDLVLWPGGDAPLPGPVRDASWDLVVDLSGTGRSRRLLARVRAKRVLRARKETMRRFAFVRLRALGGGQVRISPAIDRMAAALRPLGIEREGRMPHLPALARGPEQRDPRRGPRVLLAPGGGRGAKRWPAERFARVARSLVNRGAEIVIAGSSDEDALLREVAEGAGGAGRPGVEIHSGADPARLGAIVAACDVALTNDSGLLHVAEACGVPVVALFGPTHPRLGFAPWSPASTVLRVDIGCSPCDLHGPERCPKGHHRCMLDLSVERVEAAVLERLSAAAGSGRRA